MASRQVKEGQYYIEKKDSQDISRYGDVAEVLHVTKDRLVFFKIIYYSTRYSPAKFKVLVTGLREQTFLPLFKPLSKEKYLRFIITEGIDPNNFDDDS